MAGSDITKTALAQALKELMETEPFQKISVVDICDHCGMNRKSFYYHFQDKYELVNWIFYREFVLPRADSLQSVGWELLQSLAEYFYENRSFYKNALSVEGQNSFREYFTELFTPIAGEFLKDVVPPGEYSDAVLKFFVDTTLIATSSWLNLKQDVPVESFFPLVKSTLLGFSRLVIAQQEDEENKQDPTE